MHPVNISLPFLELTLALNTQYTLSTNIPKAADGVQFDLFFDLHDVTANSGSNGVAINTPRTITSDETGKVWITFRNQALVDKVVSGEYWVKLEEGSEATPRVEDVGQEILWTSYGVGKNLLNNSNTPQTSSFYYAGQRPIYETPIVDEDYFIKVFNVNLGNDRTGFGFWNTTADVALVGSPATVDNNFSYMTKWRDLGKTNSTALLIYQFPNTGTSTSTYNKWYLTKTDELISNNLPYTISPNDHELRKTEYLWERQMIIFTDGRIELTEPSPVHLAEADYTQFRKEYSAELNNLGDKIESIVESTNTSSKDTLDALAELNQSLNGVISEEDVQKLIDELNKKISEDRTKTTQTSDSYTQKFQRIQAGIDNNKVELEKLTGIIQSGLDEDGNTYTDWIGDNENIVRVGSDGIVMLSTNSETLKLKDGRGYMNSLYVEHELGLGNHTARKMGTEFTVFMPIGGQK